MTLTFLKLKLRARRKLQTTDKEFLSLTPGELFSLFEEVNKEEEAKLRFLDTLAAEAMAARYSIAAPKKRFDPKKFMHFKPEKQVLTPEELLKKTRVIHAKLTPPKHG